jgi:hypothetical protein
MNPIERVIVLLQAQGNVFIPSAVSQLMSRRRRTPTCEATRAILDTEGFYFHPKRDVPLPDHPSIMLSEKPFSSPLAGQKGVQLNIFDHSTLYY